MSSPAEIHTAAGSEAGRARPLGPDAVERAVILQLLEVPQPRGMRPAQLRAQLADIPAEAISTAVLALKRASLLHVQRGALFASPAARHLDRLDLIAV